MLVQQAAQARRENRLRDAQEALTEAADLCRTPDLRRELAKVLRELGEVERGLGNFRAARERYEETVAILRGGNEPSRLAHTIRHLGDVYYSQGLRDAAEPCYREALELYRANDLTHPLDLANAIRSMAMLQDDAGNTEEAVLLWEEARKLYGEMGVDPAVAESCVRLALLARRCGDFNGARKWIEEARTAAEKAGDARSLRRVDDAAAAITGGFGGN
jgi:tetratricopeptide (TPR) repeat protein